MFLVTYHRARCPGPPTVDGYLRVCNTQRLALIVSGIMAAFGRTAEEAVAAEMRASGQGSGYMDFFQQAIDRDIAAISERVAYWKDAEDKYAVLEVRTPPSCLCFPLPLRCNPPPSFPLPCVLSQRAREPLHSLFS